MEVYFDNSATTRCYDSVKDIVVKTMTEDFGNPSAMHLKGVDAEKYVKESAKTIAGILKVQEKEILFTSGGTESDNIALIGTAYANCRAGRHIITTQIEHPAILQTCAYLQEQGFEVTYLPVDHNGVIRLHDLECAMRRDTILVSIMHTNNEIGSLQPVAEAGTLIKRMNPNTVFHVDAVQGFGKFRILPKKMNIDLLSVSAHKIHGSKGVGFLYMNEKVKVRPIIFGGGQQKGMRSGTENVPAYAGLGVAAEEIYTDFDKKIAHMYELRDHFIESVQRIDGVSVNGRTDHTNAPHVVSVSVDGVRAEVMLHTLEDRQIYVSAGSACSSNKPAISSTLKSIGLKPSLLDSTIRFSFCVNTTQEEIDYAVSVMAEVIPMLRRYTRR